MNAHLSDPGGKVRLYVEAPLEQGARVDATEGQAHYLLNVMRAKAGNRVSLFNGRDGEWLGQVVDVSKRSCAFVCEQQSRAQDNASDIWLCFAPIKKTPADYLTQKATELGVSVLQPVITRRTIVSRVNLERMRANAIEAAEQSDRLTVPEIREPISLDKLLANWAAERRILFCDEAGEAPAIAEALSYRPLKREGRIAQRSGEGSSHDVNPHPTRLRASTSPLQGEVFAILTGPEGGFDPAERHAVRAKSFVTAVSLGPRILRADTAALAALAMWQGLVGDWR
jgi:16S rRNA (uracil1498-N3)-methyltransferase